MVAFSGFYESEKPPPSGDVRGYILHHRFVDCRHGGHWGDTERVVARWQRPVASGGALDMLHWAMPRALLQHLRMTIKMACDRDTFARCRRYST